MRALNRPPGGIQGSSVLVAVGPQVGGQGTPSQGQHVVWNEDTSEGQVRESEWVAQGHTPQAGGTQEAAALVCPVRAQEP